MRCIALVLCLVILPLYRLRRKRNYVFHGKTRPTGTKMRTATLLRRIGWMLASSVGKRARLK